MAARDDEAITTLQTVRDWLRYAVSRFNAAGLSYGHGTSGALDEAAFLILETLRLPIDQLEPWLDARLVIGERTALRTLIEARIASRKPAPYLTGAAYIRGRRFVVDERVIVPRSYIGELLSDLIEGEEGGGFGDDRPVEDVHSVLDLCTGGGSLAVLAALAYPAATIDAVDVSADALEVAARNIADHGLEDRVQTIRSDLFAGLQGRRYDLILSNPPYVTDLSLAGFPPEHQAEPRLAHAGGVDGLDIVRRILATAGAHLTPEGTLIVEVGEAREALEEAFPQLPFLWLDTAESAGEVFSLPARALVGDLPAGSAKPVKRKGRRLA